MNTQQAILETLQKQTTVCAEDLSQTLLKTRANIQYHLKKLADAGWIEQVQPASAAKSQGRPRHYYALSSSGRPNNLIRLADALLRISLPPDSSPEIIQSKIQEIARILLPPTPSQTGPALTRRLNQLVKELTGQGYQARWEARAAGPAVVFRNCPYYDILPQHAELCQIDAAILRNFLARDVTQQSKIQLPRIPVCQFAIRNQS